MRGYPAKSSRNLHLLIITVLVLGAYVTALKAGFLAMDDVSIMRVIQSGNVSISSLLFSPAHDYYRPLTILSYLADFLLFGSNPAGYHLTNILLHLGNALLLYYLATTLVGKDRDSGSYSLLAALLFALHPINSEAVVWISARTDLLCCFFSLICLNILIRRSSDVTPLVFMGLFLSCLFSLASKESSLFLPLLALLYFILERKKSTAKKCDCRVLRSRNRCHCLSAAAKGFARCLGGGKRTYHGHGKPSRNFPHRRGSGPRFLSPEAFLSLSSQYRDY